MPIKKGCCHECFKIFWLSVHDCDHTLLIMSTLLAKTSIQFILSSENGNFTDTSSDVFETYQSKLLECVHIGQNLKCFALESDYESNASSVQSRNPADSGLTDSSSDTAKQSKKVHYIHIELHSMTYLHRAVNFAWWKTVWSVPNILDDAGNTVEEQSSLIIDA